MQIVRLHQCFDHGFRQERWQCRSKVNILHAEREQRQQDAHRLLLVPREHERERQVVDRTAECIRQRQRDLDGAVRVVALPHIQNARQTADFAQIEVIKAVFAARECQNERIHRRGFDKLGVVISARMRTVTAADKENMPHLSALDERNNLLGVRQNRAVRKAGHEHMAAVDAAHASVVLIAAERKRLLDDWRKVLASAGVSLNVAQTRIADYRGRVYAVLITRPLRHQTVCRKQDRRRNVLELFLLALPGRAEVARQMRVLFQLRIAVCGQHFAVRVNVDALALCLLEQLRQIA